jgi:FAD/FMN-containing dehydrogenase
VVRDSPSSERLEAQIAMTELRARLRLEALEPPLRSPRDRAGRFVNYSKTVTASPTAWREPSSEEEIARCVADAGASGQRLHVVGAGHSWSPIAAPDGIAVTLDRFTGIVQRNEGSVTVRAGTRLRDLNRLLAQSGEALPILGSIAQQSVAGAIATGTHGSSLTHGNLSSLVIGARLIAGDGSVREIGESDQRLNAVRVHLGALGAITELTLRTVPAFRLTETIDGVPVRTATARVEEIGRSAEYVKVWWLPHTPSALVLRYERTADAVTRHPSPGTERFIENWLVHRAVLPATSAWLRRRPAVVPRFNAIIGRTLVKPRRVGPSPLMLSTPDPALHYETEAAVPLAAGGEAFERTVRLIDRLGVRVNHLVELRYVGGDSGFMSPAYGGNTVQLGAYTALPGHRRAYFEAFWHEMRQLGARPHWGKELDHDAAQIRSLYPMTDRFVAVRDALDPRHLFSNPFLERIFGSDEPNASG